MARIRKTDSGPEQVLRRYLRLAKISYRTYANLPGTPDIVIAGARLAVFVHGCFWHGCPHHYRSPKSNLAYWSEKLRRNRVRDRANAKRLRALGWHTATIWECQIKQDVRRAVGRIRKRIDFLSIESARGIP